MASSQGPRGDAWSGVPRRGAEGLDRSVSGGAFGGGVSEEGDEAEDGRKRAGSAGGSLKGVKEEDEDRVDARNAASRLATSTF